LLVFKKKKRKKKWCMEIYVPGLESHLPIHLLAASSLSSTGKRRQNRKEEEGTREKKNEPRVLPVPPPSVLSMVPILPPTKPVRIYLVSWLSHRSLASLAVHEGFDMFGVDWNGETFVVARIVARWRQPEGE
jgi:hypothetical protein